ncbi:MAG: hypothetical protein Q8R37_03230 [Nanoarchaeota archaeon]|nr:hypothetical protein [Nanoarchaeota archaeon]
MELIDRYGGLGVISLTNQEIEKVQVLREIISKNGIKDFIGRDSPRTPEYTALMEELFPAFPPSYCNGINNCITVIKRESDRFMDKNNNLLGKCEELVIDSRLKLKERNHNFYQADLSIVFPNGKENNNYLMTVSLLSYNLDVIDDVAELLGKRENPAVAAPQGIPWWDKFHQQKDKDKQIGFAEVPSLGTVRAVYEKAERLVDDCDRRVNVCRKDIDVLRQDSIEHPNLMVRLESRSMYNGILRGLTNQ